MDILVLTSWLILTPVRFPYLICLFGVTIEDVLWFGQESKHKNTVKLSRILLLIASTLWLWSNLGFGLICLLICSIAYSIRDANSKRHEDEKESIKLLSENQERYWNVFQFVRCLFRYVIGIMWLWSHKEELLYLSPFVAVFICVIVYGVTRFHGLGSGLDHTDTIEGNSIGNTENYVLVQYRWIEKPTNLLFFILVIFFLLYKTINYASKKFWGNICGRSEPLGCTDDITINSSITFPSLDFGPSTSTGLGSLQAMIGQNVNINGTQTIGRVSILERNFHFKINGGRDIIFNTFITRD
ncbi:hypothetical protein RND81_14G244000 [Saponaria officinalis]|uniref:Uncharacterized protein n=1 Tax=Saponaria officinalis TaxID=3572 RepID=A0AAW1GU43_SAPOF